ncbi:hypothetical protein D3C86_1796030 [compost metagenome]
MFDLCRRRAAAGEPSFQLALRRSWIGVQLLVDNVVKQRRKLADEAIRALLGGNALRRLHYAINMPPVVAAAIALQLFFYERFCRE